MEQRIPGVEFDVRFTKDREPVVVHDPSLRRTAGINSTIAELNLKELRETDVGSWFSPAYSKERIPHLEDVLEILGSAVYYDIELKIITGDLVEKVAKLLDQGGLTKRVIISSFSPRVAAGRRAFVSMAPILTPSYPLRYLMWRTVHKRSIFPAYIKPDVAFFRRRRLFMRLAQELLRQKTPWIPWTINDPGLGRFCLDNGAAGLISDDPARLARELGLALPD